MFQCILASSALFCMGIVVCEQHIHRENKTSDFLRNHAHFFKMTMVLEVCGHPLLMHSWSCMAVRQHITADLRP